jgi:ABC-type enterochelin transport system substrate-binding protein
MHVLISRSFAVLCVAALAVACSERSASYTTQVQLTRTEVVKSPDGKTIDVELEYTDCPGEQREIFQADSAFADCIAKYKIGDKVSAEVSWAKLPDGHSDSEIDKIGECTRKRDALDERSYEVVHECHDIVVNGVSVGFQCTHKPSSELLAKCPWFRRN